ncbi:MAG: cytochrome c biogenesis protein CcsA [Proteobacteria bacterium]|nr:cytochrome c biogenesis protein CcsA [Pseudomonadota bacterium]
MPRQTETKRLLPVIIATCFIAYLVCVLLLSGRFAGQVPASRATGVSAGIIGWAIHGWVLYTVILTMPGLTLNTGSAMSFVGWMIAGMGLVFLIRPAYSGLAILLLGMAGLAVLVTVLGGPGYSNPGLAWPLKAHILLSVAAYSVLSIAAALAVLLAIQDDRLRRHKPIGWLRRLPGMDTMEGMMFGAINIGFIGLTLALFSGLIFVDNLFAQHLAHKTILSLLSWAVFGTLALGRWRLGWRGRTALRWVLGGFVILALAYFGSKIVLELLLDRQWAARVF